MAATSNSKGKEATVELVERLTSEVLQKQAQHYNKTLLEIVFGHGMAVYQAVVNRIVTLQSAQFREQYRLDDDPYSVLGLTKEAPDELVKFAYLFWARRYHPDLQGGDSKPMARVNDAMERIAVERGWRVMALSDGREG